MIEDVPTLKKYIREKTNYDPEHYQAFKRITAEEWNSLFIMLSAQGNAQEDTLAEILNGILPEHIIAINQLIKSDATNSPIIADNQEKIKKLISEVALKQNEIDTTIRVPNVENKVVGAINSVYDTNVQQGIDLENVSNGLGDTNKRVEALEKLATTGITLIGWWRDGTPQVSAPTGAELTQFVKTKANRDPKNGDRVKYVQAINGGTDITYDIDYFNGVWGTPIPVATFEKGDNNNPGTVQGTKFDPRDLPIKTDMINGKIEDITSKNNAGVHTSINTQLNTLDTTQTNIISGAQPVAIANKATLDGLDRNIAETYAEAVNVYTKAEGDARYLPALLGNVLHYSKDGLVDNTPTTPSDGKQFEVTVNSVSHGTEIFDVSFELTSKLNLNRNTTDTSVLWLTVNRNCSLDFRLTTYIKQGNIRINVNTETLGETVFTANALKKLDITTIYNGLLSEEYELKPGDSLGKVLEVITVNATPTTISIYSNRNNDSTFKFLTQAVGFNVNTINGKKKINILSADWTDNGDGTFNVAITPERHEQAPSNEYGLDLQIRDSANSIQRIAFTPKITDDGVITITSYEAIDCELLIWSAVQEQQRGILALDNPDALPNIDYLQVGTLRITQTTTPSELTLPIPKNVATATVIHISNASASTQAISVNGVTIEVDNVVAFKWNGEKFQVYNTPDNTSEIYDDFNNQELNATLQQTKEQLASNMDEINLITTEISDLNTAVALKLNSKSVELKEGLAVDNLVDFYKYFFDLRKGVDRVWEFEVGKGKNENIMSIFGYPYGEQSSNSAELIVIREATSGIGYTLKIIYTSEKSSTTHIGYIKGWLISGTTYDKYIHFTGWNNARGKKWVDDIKGEVTLTNSMINTIPMGELQKPQSNMSIIKIEKNGHSYNGNLLFNKDTPNVADTTIKVETTDIYFVADYDAKQFKISKASAGTEKYMMHLFEQR